MKFQRILLKLSGEALAGAQGFGYDPQVMSEYAKSVADARETGTQIALVIGGGNIYRGAQGETAGKWRVKGDQMGMLATVINGIALAEAFEKEHCPAQVFSAFPTGPAATPYTVEAVEEALEHKRIAILTAGTGNPFFTTDSAAALRASELHCDALLKGTRVDGIYDCDPEKNADFLEKVRGMKIPVLLLINKIDESDQKSLGDIVERWHALLPNAEILPISAKNKFGTDLLLRRIQELLPESPPYFDKDQLTDKPARFFVSEIIREKILLYYDKEIPYSVEVKVERFKETEKKIHINAVIYVERESQKGIVIGHQGVALKKVSTEARKALERFFDKEVYLETFVKVDKDWRSSKKELDSFGYNPE